MLCARASFERLVVDHPEGTIDRTVQVRTSPAEVATVDVTFVAVKAHQSETAKPWLDALAGSGSTVVVLQNGVEHRRRFEAIVADGVSIVTENTEAGGGFFKLVLVSSARRPAAS